MNSVAFELAAILVLLLANGVFSMAELAIVSARKARLRRMADDGDARARTALELAESPNTFLATVQVGITLVGVVAAAFSGATLTSRLAVPLRGIEVLAPYADKIAFVVVVGLLTFLTLVLGELLPKRLGLGNPEGIARSLAGPMLRLSRIAAPLVALLGVSTDALLALLRIKPAPETSVSEDEVNLMVREGLRARVFLPAESNMVERVLALDRIPVRDLMTPRAKIIWIHVADSHETLWHRIVVSSHTTFPVYEGNRDNVVGVVSVKSIYANLAAGAPVEIRNLMTPALVVPSGLSATSLLEKFKQTGRHVALIADEFGGITGLVSLHDILEAIIGELPTAEARSRPRAASREDGSWLVDGLLPVEEFEKAVVGFPLPGEKDRDYQTFAGFVTSHLGHVPAEGETFRLNGYDVEVIDMDGHRVDKVLLIPVRTA